MVNAAGSNDRLAQALIAFLRQEFGSSVAAILGFIDILIEDARGNDLEELIPDLDRMQIAGLQLSAMIARILESPGDLGAALLDSGDDGDTDRSRLRHELRTPLSAIKGYGELLVEEAHESGRDALVADLTKVLDLTERLLGDIDKLVEFTGERKDPIAGSPIEIVGKVLHGITPLRAAAGEKRSVSSRILVVDDNASNLDLLSRRLTRDDHQVTTAESGAAALALTADGGFDLVLLDLMMPEMSGYEVLSRLKADEPTRHIPVIMISALDELDSTVRCIEAGAEDYLSKPFNPVLLRARINACLEKKLLRDREQAIAAELSVEKELSEALLLNILPRTIIERMRRGETVIADRVDEATILFSDLVDFTRLAARSCPRGDGRAARRGLRPVRRHRRCAGARKDQNDRRRLYGGGRGAGGARRPRRCDCRDGAANARCHRGGRPRPRGGFAAAHRCRHRRHYCRGDRDPEIPLRCLGRRRKHLKAHGDVWLARPGSRLRRDAPSPGR